MNKKILKIYNKLLKIKLYNRFKHVVRGYLIDNQFSKEDIKIKWDKKDIRKWSNIACPWGKRIQYVITKYLWNYIYEFRAYVVDKTIIYSERTVKLVRNTSYSIDK